MTIAAFFLVVALICFLMGAWSRWWAASVPTPYYPAFLSAGLFFFTLSQLWPVLGK